MKAVEKGKKPTLKEFKKVASDTGGNISAMASYFEVTRQTVYNWADADDDFKQVINDHRGKILDECVYTSRILARGIPILDENKQIIGWTERPDSGMVRYLMSTLGRNEGFGESVEVKADVSVKGSVNIDSWLNMNTKEEK